MDSQTHVQRRGRDAPPQNKTAAILADNAAAHTKADSSNYSTLGAANQGAKQLATLRARFALLGHSLEASERYGRQIYVAGRWGLTRELETLEDVERLLQQIGGGK